MKQTFYLICTVLLLAGCAQEPDRSAQSDPPDISRPVIQYWDGGVHMIGRPPVILFAVWSDGMVVKRAGKETMVGFVSPGDISRLKQAIRKAGFFTPSSSHILDTYGMVFPDGPVRCLSVTDVGSQRTLYYHGRDDLNRLGQIGSNADPSREQVEQFIAMWKQVVTEIEKVVPKKLEPFEGDRNVTYPQYTEKSQRTDPPDKK